MRDMPVDSETGSTAAGAHRGDDDAMGIVDATTFHAAAIDGRDDDDGKRAAGPRAKALEASSVNGQDRTAEVEEARSALPSPNRAPVTSEPTATMTTTTTRPSSAVLGRDDDDALGAMRDVKVEHEQEESGAVAATIVLADPSSSPPTQDAEGGAEDSVSTVEHAVQAKEDQKDAEMKVDSQGPAPCEGRQILGTPAAHDGTLSELKTGRQSPTATTNAPPTETDASAAQSSAEETTATASASANDEPRPIDMVRLMSSIESTRRAAEMQQRLVAATRGSGSSLSEPVIPTREGWKRGSLTLLRTHPFAQPHSPSHGLSASPFRDRLPSTSSSSSMNLLRKRKSTAQLSVNSPGGSGLSASPPPPMPSLAPRPIAAIPGSPSASSSSQGRRLVTAITATQSSPAGTGALNSSSSLISPLRSRFDRMAPFRPRSPENDIAAPPSIVPLRRGSSDARTTSSSISPPMPPPSWSPAMMRRMSSASSGGGGAQTRSSSPSGMDVDSSPRAKRSRVEAAASSSSPYLNRMTGSAVPQSPSSQYPASPRAPSYRRPSTTSQDVLLAETGLVTPGGSTQGLQQRILGHRRVLSGSAFAHASPPPIIRHGPIRTLDDLERAGTLHPAHPAQRAPFMHSAPSLPPQLGSHGSNPEVRRLSSAGMHPMMSPNGRIKKHRSQSHSVFSGARPSAAVLDAPYAHQKPDKMDLDAANALTSMLGGSPLVRARSNTVQGSRQAAFVDAHDRTPRRSMPDVFDEEEVLADRRDSGHAQAFVSPPRRAATPATPSRRHVVAVPSTAPPLYRTDARKLEDESSDEDKKAAELMIFLAQSPSPLKRDASTPAMARKSSVNATPGGIGRILFEDSLDGKKRGMAGLALEDSPRVRGGITPARKLSDLMDAATPDNGRPGGERRIRDLERDFPPIGASVPL